MPCAARHAEAVGMTIPVSKFGLIAEEYCKLFSKDGNRPDQLGDRGLEYRNVVGIPGGLKSRRATSSTSLPARATTPTAAPWSGSTTARSSPSTWARSTTVRPAAACHSNSQMRLPTCSHIG